MIVNLVAAEKNFIAESEKVPLEFRLLDFDPLDFTNKFHFFFTN